MLVLFIRYRSAVALYSALERVLVWHRGHVTITCDSPMTESVVIWHLRCAKKKLVLQVCNASVEESLEGSKCCLDRELVTFCGGVLEGSSTLH